MTHPSFASRSEAELYAADKGVRLSAADRAAIGKAQEAELSRLAALEAGSLRSNPTRIIEGFNRFYPRFLESLVGLGDVLLTFTQTMIVSFGVPIVLVLLLIVEQQRVVHGILRFEIDPALASFSAWALVIVNLVLEFQIHYIEHNANYMANAVSRFSLRLGLGHIAYFLGLSRNWQALSASPAQRYMTILRLVTFSILTLALAGSMRSVIVETEGAWYEAIVHIFTESNLALMLTWVGGFLFAATAVLGAQSLSRYVALRTVEVRASMNAQQASPDSRYNSALEEVAINYVLAKVAASQERHTVKDVTGVASSVTPFSTNGSGH